MSIPQLHVHKLLINKIKRL